MLRSLIHSRRAGERAPCGETRCRRMSPLVQGLESGTCGYWRRQAIARSISRGVASYQALRGVIFFNATRAGLVRGNGMSTFKLRYVAFAVLASCAATYSPVATAGDDTAPKPKPRCGPGGPPGAKCGPPPSPPPPPPIAPDLVHPSVSTVVSTTIGGEVTRATSGRGKLGAFVTLEKIKHDQILARTPIAFEGVSDASQLEVIQLMWRPERPGDLVFHLGANIGGWICHLAHGETTARCVIARGGGRPSK